MTEKKTYTLCYPQLGSYGIPIRHFVIHGMKNKYLAPPPSTKRTLELGSMHSPDFVCAPFKHMMGNYIEALERGADVLVQTGGTCRLGYYGELHQQILKDLGYDFKMFNINYANSGGIPGILRFALSYAPNATIGSLISSLPATARMILDMDRVDDYMRRNIGFEKKEGSFERVIKVYHRDLRAATGYYDVERAYKKAMQRLRRIPLDKPANPVRIGVVGEYFTILDPESNHHIEKKLAKMGAEIHRHMTLSSSLLLSPATGVMKKLRDYAGYDFHKFPSSIWHKSELNDVGRYARFDTGSSSISTVRAALSYAREGLDGIVHVKSFGCMPEMDAIPALHNISADYKVPILFLSYDTQNSDTGIATRLEAFYDMLTMRKEGGKNRA